jgi:hypothetical protein
MSKTPVQIQDLQLGEALQQSFVNLTYRTATTTTGTPASGVFYSSIVGRGKMVDLSNDLLPRMGVERIMTQQIAQVTGEQGPNGEAIWKPVNDKYDQVRLVGGSWTNFNNSYGQRAMATTTSDYIEITFYGTGLNLLAPLTINTTTATYSINGGSATSFWPTGTANPLGGRNYAANIVVPVVSGLALGIYTLKIILIAGAELHLPGFEILNESTSVKTSAGSAFVNGQKKTLSALDSSSYNSSFTNTYGTAGTRGGRVLVYMKSDGTIAKDVQYVNTASAYLSSADHTNEEVIRTYTYREFAAGRSDDFSGVMSAASKAFTLDDGTTTLSGVSIDSSLITGADALRLGTGSGFFILTFVGTGIDVLTAEDPATTTRDTLALTVDGVSQGNLSSTVSTTFRIEKIVSGLPYGTHTVKVLLNTAGNGRTNFGRFIVYGPKKPALPSGAIELADYNIVADYSLNSSTAQFLGKSAGTIFKSAVREAVYVGTWGIGTSLSAANAAGWYVGSGTLNDTVSYTFLGTGFEWDTSANSGSPTWLIQIASGGGALTNLGTTGTQNVASGSYNSGTSTLTNTSAGYTRFSVSGLAFGLYTVQFKLSAIGGGNCDNWGFSVITPIHVHKSNGPFVVQNTLAVGSTGINDGRTLSSVIPVQKQSAQAVGITSGPTTTSTSYVPVTDMSATIKTTGNPIEISTAITCINGSINQDIYTQIYVDGNPIAVETIVGNTPSTINQNFTANDTAIVPVTAGWHKIDVFTRVSSGTVTLMGVRRVLKVREI